MPSDAAQTQGSVRQVQDSVPQTVRTRFGHAAVQVVADEAKAEVLHIKGAAADPDLRSSGGGGEPTLVGRREASLGVKPQGGRTEAAVSGYNCATRTRQLTL